MKRIKRAIAVLLLIAILLLFGFLGFTCKRVTNETIVADAYKNTAFMKKYDTMVAFTGKIVEVTKEIVTRRSSDG